MTEAEWLDLGDPQPMLEFLRGKVSERKLRLFAVACCRRIVHLVSDKHVSHKSIEFAERLADGLATQIELHGAAWGKPGEAFPVVLWEAWDAAETSADYAAGTAAKAALASNKVKYEAWEAAFSKAWQHDNYPLSEARERADATMPVEWVEMREAIRNEERKSQAIILRHIVGNPFRPFPLPDRWPSTVVQLANALYNQEECGFALHDALTEAGYSELANHFRQEQPHPKGCFALDLILAKS